MTKVYIVLAILALTSLVSADGPPNPTLSCSQDSNPMLEILGLAHVDTPVAGSELKYCATLQNSTSCCSAETVNSFQAKADELRDRIKDTVIARDKILADTRDVIMPKAMDSIKRFKTAAEGAMNGLGEMLQNMTMSGNLPPMGDGGSGDIPQMPEMPEMPDMSDMSGGFDGFANMTETLREEFDKVKANFGTYQESRAECIIEMVKMQAASWCVACDPDWRIKRGPPEDQVSLGEETCNTLQKACYSYISLGVEQNQMLGMRTLVPMLDSLSGAFEKIGQGKLEGLGTFLNITENQGELGAPPNQNEAPTVLPPDCTEESCPWICHTLFANDGVLGSINEEFLAAGGEINMDPVISEGRLLKDRKSYKGSLKSGRMLDTTWTTSSSEAGVTVTFEKDPAGVDNSSVCLKGALVSAIVLMLALFV